MNISPLSDSKHEGYCKCLERRRETVRLVDGFLRHDECELYIPCNKCRVQTRAVSLIGSRQECRDCSPLMTDQYFSKDLDLETELFDGFIYNAGGVRMTDLIEGHPQFQNADYYFKKADVVVELKTLETEFAQSDGHLQRFAELRDKWLREGKLTAKAYMGLENPPPDFVEAHLRMLRNPLQRISNKANKQIKETKEFLGRPSANGLVLYLIDGFLDMPPAATMALIGDPMTRGLMSSIDAFVIFTLRERVQIPGSPGPTIFWTPGYRNSEDSEELSKFVNSLGRQFFTYLEEIAGTKFGFHEEGDGLVDGFQSAAFENSSY